jgi:hypothetical protein
MHALGMMAHARRSRRKAVEPRALLSPCTAFVSDEPRQSTTLNAARSALLDYPNRDGGLVPIAAEWR